MYQFAIDMGEENNYTPAAPKGVEAKIFENLAASNWQLALSQNRKRLCDPLPAWDWVWVWVAPGPPLGHPMATQGPPKRGASVDLRKCLCLQQKRRNSRVGPREIG
jgi:hypothetical protein